MLQQRQARRGRPPTTSPTMKSAKITVTYESRKTVGIECETNGTPLVTIIGALDVLKKQLAEQLVEEARKQVGDDPDAIARWIDLQRQAPGQN